MVLTPFLRLVTRRASPPFIDNRYTSDRGCSEPPAPAVAGSPVGLEERKANDCPSGLQRGELTDCGLVVNCHGARLPSVATIQIEELRRFCARSILVTTYAANFPSGEICGSLRNSKEK